MTHEYDLNRQVYDADQSRLVLENEAFKQAMADIKQELVEQWKQSPARDQEGREKLWQLLMLAGKLESNLKTRLETGKLAQIELAQKKTLPDRAKEFLGWA